jgi:hypothetical protein
MSCPCSCPCPVLPCFDCPLPQPDGPLPAPDAKPTYHDVIVTIAQVSTVLLSSFALHDWHAP